MIKKILLSIASVFIFTTIWAADVTVSVGNASGKPSDMGIEVPISVSNVNGLGIISADIQLNYDSSKLVFSSLTIAGTIAQNWNNPIYNTNTAGQIKIALFGTASLSGQGKLLKVYFDIKPQATAGTSVLTLVKAKFGSSLSSINSLLQNGTFTILSQNRPPVLDAIGNKQVNEGATLVFNTSANDSDADTLTYSASNLPQGASFNPTSHSFSWTPNYTQAGSYTKVHFEVSDGKGGVDSEEITITVGNINQPPVLAAIGNKAIDEGQLLEFTLSAEDIDKDKLTYSTNGLPQGATLHSNTGKFNWTPTYEQAGNYNVTFTLSDGALSDSEAMTITVNNAMRKYKLEIKTEYGSVNRSPNQDVYDENSSVILTAIANEGYVFKNWSGDLSGAGNPATLKMDKDKSVTAVFVDTTPPDNCSLIVNQGAEYSNNPKVNLAISARDLGSGLLKAQFSNDGITWSPQINYEKTKEWSLSSGDGLRTIFAKVIDAAGNESKVFSDSIILDTQPPQKPKLNFAIEKKTKNPELRLSGTKDANSSILINGQEKIAIDAKTDWSYVVRLSEGNNKLTITSKDIAGNESASLNEEIMLKAKVKIRIISPLKRFLGPNDLIAGSSDVAILYLVDDESSPRAKRVTLEEGKETKFTIEAEDDLGNKGEELITLGLYSHAPQITVTNYQNNQSVSSQDIAIRGEIVDSGSGVQYVKVNGRAAEVSGRSFAAEISLSEGQNNLVIETADNAGNTNTSSLALSYVAPPAPTPVVIPIIPTPVPAPSSTPNVEPKEKKSETSAPSVIYIGTIAQTTAKVEKSQEKKASEAPQKHQDNAPLPQSISQRQGEQPDTPPYTYYEESREPMPKIKELKQAPPEAVEKLKKIIKMPVITVKKIKRFWIFRSYKLEVSGITEQPLAWELAEKERLPFGLKLDKGKGIISGIVFGRKEIELRFIITTSDMQKKEVVCNLKID